MSLDWQHPFVDVFKSFGVFEIAQHQGKGQVSVVQDNGIGRKIIRLQGAISANNCVTIPDPIQGSKSLNLTGRYVISNYKKIYAEFLPTKGRYFTMHFEITVSGREPPVKFVVSNMYDVHKVQQQTLQIPYPKNACNKWTILILDLEYFLGNFGLLPTSSYKSFKGIHALKSFQICSAMNIRGIFTSDKLYDWETMPKQMLFKMPTGGKWSDEYQIAYWPTLDIQPQVQKQQLQDVAAEIVEGLQKIDENRERLRMESQKSNKKQSQQENRVPIQIEELVKKRDNQQLQSRNIENTEHPLQPYPMMTLNRVIGFTVNQCPDVRWSGDNLVYAAGNILVLNSNEGQKFLMGHSAHVACLDASRDGQWLVSGQSGKQSVIRIWKKSGECLSAFATPHQNLINVAFSADRKLLLSAGSDDHNREIIIIWGLGEIEKTRKPLLTAKQTSSVNILNIKFSPTDNTRIISCGHENIRFWRLKDGHLPGASVVLNHHARNTTFSCFDFEFSYEQMQVSQVYFGSKRGVLFKVGYAKQELIQVYQVHTQAITAVSVSAGFCVTGSLDQYLRVWPLDFSEFYIEAKHEGVITSLDISIDGLQVACGTSTGGLGILDISSHHYKTVMRSHTSTITMIKMHPYSGLLISLSLDCTIRLWDLNKLDQVYEFTFPADDTCTTLSAHPAAMYFAAGFKSGIVRIFDIENTTILLETKHHDSEIQSIQYSPKADLIAVSDSSSIHKIYDVNKQYAQIKTIQSSQCKFNQIAFSIDGAVFAITEANTNIELWESSTMVPLLRINTKFQVKSVQFAPNNVELICSFNDGRIVIYGIEIQNNVISAYYLREQQFMHKQTINAAAVSPNMKYLLTCGNEAFIKIWDYEFTIKGPGSCQVFIGHSGQINSLEICDQGQTIISAGGDEGLFIWKFNGYCGKNERLLNLQEYPQVHKVETQVQQDCIEEPVEDEHLDEISPDTFINNNELVQVQSLEREVIEEPSSESETERPFKKDHFQPVRVFQNFEKCHYDYERRIAVKSRRAAKKQRQNKYIPNRTRKELNLPFRQYIIGQKSLSEPTLNSNLYIGYNNESHDNVVWCRAEGWFAYASENYVIIEKLKKERDQQLIILPFVVSVLQLDHKQKVLAVGAANKLNETAPIHGYSTDKLQLLFQLNFHTTGVHQIVFTKDDKFILSLGNMKECTVAVWDISNKKLITSSYTLEKLNDLRLSNYVFHKERLLEFATVGRDQIHFWALTKDGKLEYFDVFIPRDLNGQLEEITSFDYIVFESKNVNETNSVNAGSLQDIEFTEETREQVSFKIINQQLVHQEEKKHESDAIAQFVILGTKKGEILVIKYGEFKILYRKQVCQEIISLRISQLAHKILITSVDAAIFQMDLTNISSQAGLLNSGFAFQKFILPALTCGYDLEPSHTHGIFGLQNGSLYLISIKDNIQFLLAATNGDYTTDTKSDKLLPFNVGQIKQSTLFLEYLIVIHLNGCIRIWNIITGEMLIECQWDKEVTCSLVDAQSKQVFFFQEGGQIKVIELSRLDIIDDFHLAQKEGPDTIISTCFAIYDSIPARFLLDQSGSLYYQEVLLKNSEFVIRINKTLQIEGTVSIHDLSDKKVLIAVEAESSQVSTFFIDYNSGRDQPFGFVLYDQVVFLQNPHGNLDTEQSKQDTQLLYSQVSVTTSVAIPKGLDNVYLAIVDNLQYVYGRNFHLKQTIFLIPLNDFPLTFCMTDSSQVCVALQNNTIQMLDENQVLETHQTYFHNQTKHLVYSQKRKILIAMNDQHISFFLNQQ